MVEKYIVNNSSIFLFHKLLLLPSMMIPKQTVQEVLEASKVEEVVGEFVSLSKRGVNRIGLCPFHNEKTPSFTVSPAKNIFKCFGCGESGSSVDFLMKHEHFNFPQAVKWLADKYNIHIEEEEQTPEQIAAENEREGLFAISKFAAEFFNKTLNETDKGRAIGLSYFNERGYSQDIITKFNLGYSPEDWDALAVAAQAAGYPIDALVQSGLVIKKDQGGVYDRFRNRVIFPIHNASGRVLGFGGRILIADKKKPKYVNSPESLIYDKSNVLFGLYSAKNQIIKKDNCYLVEGYTDVISLYQSGIENSVSSSGTSLTEGQIRLIKRYTPNITILYDGDAAGIKASFRGIDMIVRAGMNVRVILFPDGEDPDSYAKSHSASDLSIFLESSAKNFINFKSELLSKEAGNDPLKKAQVVRQIVETIALVPEQLNRIFFIRETSELLNVKEEVLTNEVAKILRKEHYKKQEKHNREQQQKAAGIGHTPSPELGDEPPEDFFNDNLSGGETKTPVKSEISSKSNELEIIRLLLNFGEIEFKPEIAKVEDLPEEKDEEENTEEEEISVIEFIIGDLLEDDISFDDEILNSIYKEYANAYENDRLLNSNYFVTHENDEIRKLSGDLLSENHILSPLWFKSHQISITPETDHAVVARACYECIYSLKVRKISELKKKLMKKMATEGLSSEAQDDIMVEYHRYDIMQNKLNQGLGRIIGGKN